MDPTKQQMTDVLRALNSPKLRAAARGAGPIQKAIGPRVQGWLMDHMLESDRWETVRQLAKATGKNAATIRRGLKMLVLARFVEEGQDTRKVYKIRDREAWLRIMGAATE